MKRTILALVALVCLTACSNDDNTTRTTTTTSPDGTERKADTPVELKDITLAFKSTAGTAMVNIGSDKGWWITEITAGEETVTPTSEEKELMAGGGGYEAECQWVSLKRSGSSMEVAVTDNEYEERTFTITLAADGNTATITGTQEEMSTGNWEDNINLTPENMAFTAEGGTQYSTTNKERQWWAVCTIYIDGNAYNIPNEDINLCYDEHVFEKTCEWLSVRRDNEKLYVTAEPNTTGKEREFAVNLVSGNLHVWLHGTQSAK